MELFAPYFNLLLFYIDFELHVLRHASYLPWYSQEERKLFKDRM